MTKTAEAKAPHAEHPADPKAAFQGSIFRDVKLDRLIESRRNPRREFDEASLGELVESVKRFGVLTPLIVRPVGNDGKYEILAGARRFRAAKAAELQNVPCRVVEVENDTALEVVVVENLQRKDIHPLEEAEGFHEILDLSNGDMAGLCAKVGKKPIYVAKRLSLLNLIDRGKKLYLKGGMTEAHAVLIARLQKEDQKNAVAMIEEDVTSVRELREWIEQELIRDLSKASFSKTDATLVPKAGTCEACPKRTGNAKDLFDDIKQGDRCTDGACFGTKMRAHMDRLQKQLQDKGFTVYGIWDSWHGSKPPQGVLADGQWVEIKKKDFCEKAAKGIVVDGLNAGKSIDICADREHCKIHGSIGLHGKTPAERDKTRKDVQKQKIEKEVRIRVFKEIYEKQPGTIELEGLRAVCLHAFERLWHQSRIALVRALGWELKKHKDYAGFDLGPIEKKIKGFATPGEAAKFMVAVVCAGELDVRGSVTDNLSYFASENKVSWTEIRKKVEEEHAKKAKRMPKGKPAQKKQSAKAKKAQPKAEPKAPTDAGSASTGEEE